MSKTIFCLMKLQMQGKIKIILTNKFLLSTLFQIEFIKIEKNALVGWRNSILKPKKKCIDLKTSGEIKVYGIIQKIKKSKSYLNLGNKSQSNYPVLNQCNVVHSNLRICAALKKKSLFKFSDPKKSSFSHKKRYYATFQSGRY